MQDFVCIITSSSSLFSLVVDAASFLEFLLGSRFCPKFWTPLASIASGFALPLLVGDVSKAILNFPCDGIILKVSKTLVPNENKVASSDFEFFSSVLTGLLPRLVSEDARSRLDSSGKHGSSRSDE